MCVLLAVASSICEWLMHEPLVPVYIFSGLVWNTKFQKHWSHSQDLLIDDMRSRCTNFMYGLNIFFFLVFFAYFVLAACMYSSKEQCIVSWKKQDGWICQGRCPHVSQSAGRKLHWHRHTTHTLPTIYTQFVTQVPTAAEAILPSCTSLDLALLRTLSSVL